MNKNMKILTTVVILAVAAFSAQAARYHMVSADEGIAFRFYNGNGTGTNVSITIASGGASAANLVTNGVVETTIDGSGNTDTIAEFTVLVAAATNSAGNSTITIDKDCSLDADGTDGELLDGTYTATPGTWGEVLWDTSENEQLNLYVASGDNYGFTIRAIGGYPQGTGECVLSIYRKQVLAWQAVVDIPYGVATDNTATVLSNIIELPILVGVRVDQGEGVFIRATRTTMTGGTLGIVTE